MSLPYDIARCHGVRTSPLCVTCQRKTQPGRPDGPQTYISPSVFEQSPGVDRCPNELPERDPNTSDMFGDEK